jgi:hypothetical protein
MGQRGFSHHSRYLTSARMKTSAHHHAGSPSALSASCADDESGSSRLIWSQSSSALGAHEEVERSRPETVALSDRLQPAYQKVLESWRRCRIGAEVFVAG